MSRTKVLSTATVNYLGLIANGNTYRVPPYQRAYAWTEEEWEDLWNDILDLRRQPEGLHYMGALVVHGQSDREFTIIDGQQRLATIGVLSLAVIAKLHRMADQKEETEAHRLSRARTRANTSAAGREEISPRRYASYLRIEPELFDVLIQVFVQRIDRRSRQFGLLLRTKLVELLSELRNLSGHLRYSQG